MKKPALFVLFTLVLGVALPGTVPLVYASDEGYNAIVNHVTETQFIAGSITPSKITRIVNAGGRAPSANNRQPWHFTVVQNVDLGKQIVPNFQNGNVLIVISAQGDGKTNGSAILDCALAAESMYLAAQALDLGSRIYTGPVDTINNRLKGDLGLPSGHSAVVVVRVGMFQRADGVTAASARKDLNSIRTNK